MNNYVAEGNVLTFVAPSGGVVSGTPYMIEDTVLIATVTADGGASFEGAVRGVFTVPKTSAQQWKVGEKVYWAAGTGKFDNTGASGDTLCGRVAAAAANPSDTGDILLLQA